MSKPLWNGAISFGLLNIPVQLVAAERGADELHLRMLDSRNNAPIRNQRVNSETGKEVPWKDVVKGFEYDKGSFVVISPEDIAKASPEGRETVDIQAFIDPAEVSPQYFEKPYYLLPGRKAEKGYVLLRDTLAGLKKAGLARVVIRTREYLALVLPEGSALLLVLLRFQQELIAADTYEFPKKGARLRQISERERDMARQLVESLCTEWKPEAYRDEFHDRLRKVIKTRISAKAGVKAPGKKGDARAPAGAATNVVDFMALLKQSLENKKRGATPAAPDKTARRPRRAAR